MKHLIFFILANVIGLCYSWSYENHIWFADDSVYCRENECNITLQIRPQTTDSWSPILIMVKLGHTDKIDHGELAIYDVHKDSNVPRIYGNKNKFAGSIQDFGTHTHKSLACNRGSNCAIEMCIKRGRSAIVKKYTDEGAEEDTTVTWSPLITFTELWFGPRFEFRYEIENGIKTRLKMEGRVHYWSTCDKAAYGDGDYYQYALVPIYI